MDIYNSISPLPRGYKLTYSDPWCAAFVSAVGERAGLTEVLPECSCDAMIALYQKSGQYYGTDYSPQPGDLVFYDWDKSGTADHVGIIAETGSTLKVIEGNVSDSVDYRLISKGSPLIKGYATPLDGTSGPPVGAAIGRPQNPNGTSGSPVGAGALDGPQKPPLPKGGCPEGAGGLENQESLSQPAADSSLYKGAYAQLSIPTLSPGTTGPSVRALQHLLIGNGHSCGTCGADGEFGAKTRDALIGFQRRTGLTPDAIAGKQTWTKLLL